MSRKKIELSAIYRLEFYRKQNWKLCNERRRKRTDDKGEKNDNVVRLNQTYYLEKPETDVQYLLNKAFIETELGTSDSAEPQKTPELEAEQPVDLDPRPTNKDAVCMSQRTERDKSISVPQLPSYTRPGRGLYLPKFNQIWGSNTYQEVEDGSWISTKKDPQIDELNHQEWPIDEYEDVYGRADIDWPELVRASSYVDQICPLLEKWTPSNWVEAEQLWEYSNRSCPEPVFWEEGELPMYARCAPVTDPKNGMVIPELRYLEDVAIDDEWLFDLLQERAFGLGARLQPHSSELELAGDISIFSLPDQIQLEQIRCPSPIPLRRWSETGEDIPTRDIGLTPPHDRLLAGSYRNDPGPGEAEELNTVSTTPEQLLTVAKLRGIFTDNIENAAPNNIFNSNDVHTSASNDILNKRIKTLFSNKMLDNNVRKISDSNNIFDNNVIKILKSNNILDSNVIKYSDSNNILDSNVIKTSVSNLMLNSYTSISESNIILNNNYMRTSASNNVFDNDATGISASNYMLDGNEEMLVRGRGRLVPGVLYSCGRIVPWGLQEPGRGRGRLM